MRKKIKLLIILLSFILFPSLVSAECSDQQIHELNKLVDNIQFKYEHTGNNLFKVTLYNIPENITGTSNVGMFNAVDFDNPTNSVDGFIGGYNYQIFYITNSKNECGKTVLKTVSIKIPVYNIHSKKDICKDEKYEDFKYCNEFLDKKISEEEFSNYLKEYKVNVDNFKNNVSLFKKIKNIVFNNWIIIFVSITLIVILIVSISIFKNKKRKL